MCFCNKKKGLSPQDREQIISCLEDFRTIIEENHKKQDDEKYIKCIELSSMNESIEYMPYTDNNIMESNLKVIDRLIKALENA